MGSGSSDRFYLLGLQNHWGQWLLPWNQKILTPWKESYHKPRQCIKKQRHHFTNKDLSSQSYGFSSSHVWMWELDHKEGWAPKNWCFQTLMLEKTLESPLDCKEIKPVNPKGNQPWIFTGRTDAKDEAQILWPPDAKMTLFTSGSGFSRPWCWERLNTKGERGGRGWVGWIASLTQWAWIWANFGRWWRKKKTGML